MKRRGRATAPATAVPMENARAPPTSFCMFMPLTISELRGQENSGTFLKRFRIRACVRRCDSALESETVVKTSGTPLAELERLHEHSLVENSLKAWQALTKALEKEKEIMEMVIDIGSLCEAWRTLISTRRCQCGTRVGPPYLPRSVSRRRDRRSSIR